MNQREDDEIVTEVRRTREQIFWDSGGTLDGLYARLKALEKNDTRPMVSPAPRRPERVDTTAR